MGSMMELRHRMLIDNIPDYQRLPSEYEKLPYVTANGNQSLRTAYIPTRYNEFHLRLTGGSAGTIISAGTGTYQIAMIGGFSSTGWYYKFFSSATISATANYTHGVWYDVDIDSNGTMHTNGKTFACAYAAPLSGDTNLFLFERRNYTELYVGSLSEFWIKNNGEFKMYLIPCKRKSDQKVGLYDTISKTFFTSARSDFIAGSN